MYRDGKSVFAGAGYLNFPYKKKISWSLRFKRFAKKGYRKYVRRLAAEDIKEQKP